jgi:hypothetical protein
MNFSNYYNTTTTTTVEDDRAAIIAGFQDIIKRGSRPSFRLVNYYKGLPICYPATIVDIDRGTLDLDVHQQQAVAIEATGCAFIKCDYFPSPIFAEVQSSDVRRMTASLKNFAFVEIMAERRDSLRLQLGQPTVAEIKGDAHLLTGKLLDISLGGFSVRTEERCPIGMGEEVDLRIMVPNLLQNTATKIETRACHIATVSEPDNDVCRFSFQVDAQNESVISRFIFQRQVEIIREIKESS